MSPKKKARTGQRANVTPGVAVDPIFDDAGENPRSENIPPVTTLLDSTIIDQTALVPTPTEGCGTAGGGVQSSGGSVRFYGMRGRQNLEASPDVVTGIFTVQSHDVYALIDQGSTLSYVTPYVAVEFGMEPEHLHEPFSVSTPVGESILVAWVYRDCVIMLHGQDTVVDLI
ncbi:uncharacterized protein [Nicotiana tomentosiformis]|uniref:uncharacterized protein n=1 Tax=Nicotiana tomentosiformis TaxID=4098 RepID=UPI00388C3A1D